MKMYSEVTKEWYESEDMVLYVNPKQVSWMMNKGCKLFDVSPDNEKLIFTLLRADHKKYFSEWMERKAKEE